MDFMFKIFCISSHYIYTPGVWCSYTKHNEEQISDNYPRTVPPYLKRLISLIDFGIRNHRSLSRKGQKMVLFGAVYLLRAWQRYWRTRLVSFVRT